MSDQRRSFDLGWRWDDASIILHPNGSLTIEASGEYGDSEAGFGSITTSIHMDAAKVAEFRKFLAREAE